MPETRGSCGVGYARPLSAERSQLTDLDGSFASQMSRCSAVRMEWLL
ncbi:MAG: hypothetical protein QNJ03_06825 [Dinoroseobacter sp.]|nr:hypothetical protein [Dinoroseobacter sp.]